MFNHKTKEGYSMNNVRKLSIILLLSVGLVGMTYAAGNSCNTGCDTKNDCNDECRTSTVFVPRSITTDLTYRNNLSFYHRRHDAACNFFTWDSTLLYQRNRNESYLGAGFLGTNPLVVSEVEPADVGALNLGLGVEAPNNFTEEYSICPRREVVAWLPQLYFNLDCFATGLWAEISFAVARAKHELRQTEGTQVSTFGDADNVAQALAARETYWAECDSHTGVDNVLFQVGYNYTYCANDAIGIYFAGVAPTGKSFDESRWFPPFVGSKHGSIGFGLNGDYTAYECDADSTELVFQTELLYLYGLRHNQCRRFDLCNGSLSRWLLVATEDQPGNPQQNLWETLTTEVEVRPRHKVQWWANLHWQWCNWAAEFSYNLWWRAEEEVCPCGDINFDKLGIFSQTCNNPLTTRKDAVISEIFNPTGTQDGEFTRLVAANIDYNSGAAQEVLTHKISAAFAYNTVWCDCYPMYVGLGAGYEFASNKDKRHAPENWHIYGKWDIAF